jgi:hypothetical protein
MPHPDFTPMNPASTPARALFVGSHPGQELMVFGWLMESKPDVFILTDGSGAKDRPRIDSSRQVLEAAGIVPGSLFGGHTDRALYGHLVGHNGSFFVDLAEMVANHILGRGIQLVVAPAADGFNPVQDALRLVVDAACRLVTQHGVRNLENRGVHLQARPEEGMSDRLSRVVILDEETLARKVGLARSFQGLESAAENLLGTFGPEAYRVEVLRRVTRPLMVPCVEPDYEKHGAERVAAGLYPTVIRYADHLAPVNWALRSHLEGPTYSVSRAA